MKFGALVVDPVRVVSGTSVRQNAAFGMFTRFLFYERLGVYWFIFGPKTNRIILGLLKKFNNTCREVRKLESRDHYKVRSIESDLMGSR